MSLILYSTYTTTFVGLFRGNTLLESKSTLNKAASAELPLLTQALLSNHGKELLDLAFIGVHQGPGPFTSLRVTIAFAHGLLLAAQIPLVGINGFFAFAESWHPKGIDFQEHLLILLEAFCDEVYYALFDQEKKLLTAGYCHKSLLENQLEPLPIERLTIVGNAQEAFSDKKNNYTVQKTEITTPSLEDVGKVAFRHYQQNPQGDGFLLPLYLKQPTVHKSVACPSQP